MRAEREACCFLESSTGTVLSSKEQREVSFDVRTDANVEAYRRWT